MARMAALKAVRKVITKAVAAEATHGVPAIARAVTARAVSARAPQGVGLGRLAGTMGVVVLETRAAIPVAITLAIMSATAAVTQAVISATIPAEVIRKASLRRVRAVPLVAGWAGAVMRAGERGEQSAVPARHQPLAEQVRPTDPVVLAVRPHPPGDLAGLAEYHWAVHQGHRADCRVVLRVRPALLQASAQQSRRQRASSADCNTGRCRRPPKPHRSGRMGVSSAQTPRMPAHLKKLAC